jgi:hypothetical protein
MEGEKNTKWRCLGMEMHTFELEFGKRIGDGRQGYRIIVVTQHTTACVVCKLLT